MGREWDSDIALKPEAWGALAEHLYSGGFIFAFGGPRTYHRLACALEEAGLRLHQPITHLQAQGFPKATKVKVNGEEAEAFKGHRYGLQSLKPCIEFIAIAQKPYIGKPVESIVETGAGALNIEAGRIGLKGKQDHWDNYQPSTKIGYGNSIGGKRDSPAYNPSGRWPPNFALSHIAPHFRCQSCQSIHPMQPVIEVCECGGELEFVEGCKRVGVKRVKGTNLHGKPSAGKETDKQAWGLRYNLHTDYADPDGLETVAEWECVKDKNAKSLCPVARLDEDAGERKSGGHPNHPNRTRDSDEYQNTCYGRSKAHLSHAISDSGNASRFYHNSDWSHETAERLAQEDPVKYCPKAAKSERSKGLDDFYWKRDKQSPSGFMRVSQEEWEALPKRERAKGNIHPTVKPIALTRWLATLLLPPIEYAPRRLLVPFSGSGSENIGALLAGWEEITAVDIVQAYCDINTARSTFWLQVKQKEIAQPSLL